ncbi:MAG: UDP-N-acetylmuramoyl-L-alanine--D-glutamate ligase [Candidatus Kerfeldbacteria bacterium]|nr:UDP-N-acetylmuramoyl-L-alanine--D-glutamate ligase [Candidatus Kerfeldbacteria bacterium]
MNFQKLKNVCILGAGIEGNSTAVFLSEMYPHLQLSLVDQKNTDYPTDLSLYDCVVVSPGIPPSTPLLGTARAITTATNIFLDHCKGKVIAVTGSKGKSTTASLIAHLIQTAKLPVSLVGNIGFPALTTLLDHNTPDHLFVYEMSSYQASRLEKAPDIAVIVNLFPEHMNYHGSLEQYYSDKMKIATLQTEEQTLIYNSENAELVKRAAQSRAKKIAYPQKDGYYVGIDGIYFQNNRLASFEELQPKGAHNASNIVAALIAATTLYTIDHNTLHHGLLSFITLKHRLQIVSHKHSITWVDDAISTTPESTLAALHTFPNTGAIILGGLNRGYDFTELAKEIAKRKIPVIVFFPSSGETIEKAIIHAGWVAPHTLHTTSMGKTVEFIAEHCKKNTAALLSCASPSYTIFKNFEDKGNQFQECVRRLQ